MNKSQTNDEKEELLIQALKTQYSILQLLDSTLLEIYQSERQLPKSDQNDEVIELAHRVRNIVARKPHLKEIYKKLEEEYGVKF